MQLGLSFSLVFIFGIFQCHGIGHSYGAFFVKSLLFVHKLSNFIVLTKHSQTPASLFLAWRFDLYPKVRQLCTTIQLFWVCPRVSKRQAKNKLAGVCECFVRVFSQRDAFQFHCCCAPYCHVLDLHDESWHEIYRPPGWNNSCHCFTRV